MTPSPITKLRACRRRPAFTLIEMITVIAIITILAGLLVMGVGKAIRTTKTRATAADLENAQGLFDEMNAHAGMSNAPAYWLWRNLNSPTYTNPIIDPSMAPSSTMGLDFWRVPNKVQTTPGGPFYNDSLDAQGSIADLDGTGMGILRNGSRDVLNTQLAMRILLS